MHLPWQRSKCGAAWEDFTCVGAAPLLLAGWTNCGAEGEKQLVANGGGWRSLPTLKFSTNFN